MTLMNIAMTTLLNGICLGAILAAAMMLLLKFFPRLNPTTRFTVLWMTLLAVVALLATPLTPRPSSPEPRIESLVVVSPSPVVILAPAPAQVYRPGRKTHASHVDSVAAQRPGRGILRFAKPEIKRNGGVARLAAALQSFVRDPRHPPSAAIARFEPCQWADVAWLLPPDNRDSAHAS